MPCLEDPHPRIRFTTAQFLGSVAGPDPDLALSALETVSEGDSDIQVLAATLTVLTCIDPNLQRARERERAALGSAVPLLRLTAALSGLSRSGRPTPMAWSRSWQSTASHPNRAPTTGRSSTIRTSPSRSGTRWSGT